MSPLSRRAPPFPEDLLPLFSREGLTMLGVAAARPDPGEEARYRARIDAGAAADMTYLARHAPLKFHPEGIVAGCRSVLVAALGYYQDTPPERRPGASGRIARYAWGRDYHKVLGERLRRIARDLERRYPGERFAAFTDATPLAERHYAERAGIGFTGRHGLLIAPGVGSWLLIGEILATMPFAPTDAPDGGRAECPRSCRRCMDACPTRALAEPYRIDARRCISYLTIEHKGLIAPDLRPLLADWLFGCDLCQEACPFGQRPAATTMRDFLAWRAGPARGLEGILYLQNHADVVAAFAGSPVVRAGRRGLVRNACVVAANTGATSLLPRLDALSMDPDGVVADHAVWAAATLRRR